MASRAVKKGHFTEELLRGYFLRAGLYVVRSIPLKIEGEDLTDVDIWLYEKSTGSSRRRQIVDARSRTKPKAIERLFWTKGLAELLEVDGAYVATTDTRPLLKEMARRLGVSILDGTDIKRMKDSKKVLFPERIHEEDVVAAIMEVDESHGNRELQRQYQDMKAALIDSFGPGTVNRSLEHFAHFSRALTSSHPDGRAAAVALRLSYVAASFVAIAIDSVLTTVSFKSNDEKRRTIVNVVRYGDDDEKRGLEKVRVAARLVEMYAPNGAALSQSISSSVKSDYDSVPAEGIADFVLTHVKSGGLFQLARDMDLRAFSGDLLGYDGLSVAERALLGVLLDFSDVDRQAFARGWKCRYVVDTPLLQLEEG